MASSRVRTWRRRWASAARTRSCLSASSRCSVRPARPMSEPLELPARPDKWFLSAGDGVVFAPPLPTWLDTPGFWDEATLHQYPVAPLFTVTALDADGRESPMRAASRRWTPADLSVEWRLANGMTAVEVRTLQPGGV